MATAKIDDWVDLGADKRTGSENEVSFNAKLQSVAGFPLFVKDSAAVKAVREEKESTPEEYLLTLKAKVNVDDFPWLKKVQDEQVEFILILDRSGSMNGTPWAQVQSAMLRILEMTKDNPHINVRIMTYNDQVDCHAFSGKNMAAANMGIKQIRATGMTNFIRVFEATGEYLRTGLWRAPGEKKKGLIQGVKDMILPSDSKAQVAAKTTSKPKTFIFFMTDGNDTCNNGQQILVAKEKLQKDMEVVVNVIGFAEHHNDAFLESLSLIGTSDGTYNYIKPDMGDSALEERLLSLLESTTGLVGQRVFIQLKISKDSKARFLGDWFGDERDEVVMHTFMIVSADGKEANLETTKFVLVPTGSELILDIKLMHDLRDDSKEYPGKLLTTEIRHEEEQDKLKLRKLRTCLNMVTARLGESVDGEKTEESKKEIKGWVDAIKHHHELIKESVTQEDRKKDEDLNKLAETVLNGLKICDTVMTRDSTEDDLAYGKRVRDTHAKYNLQSRQMHNMKQVKKGKISDEQSRNRSHKQQMYSDLC